MTQDRINRAILECKEERLSGFGAQIIMGTDKVKIQTKMSRDHRRSHNGGEYYFWESIWPNESGEVLMQQFASCDFWQPEEEPERLDITYEQAVELVQKYAAEASVPVS